ncbi:4-hydroxy-tetrahydrodipicolinate reductase [uncultured Planktosalinus sp.]|uniref:4-hydroxy-tetrahydrodipicolinate reductase n=1 Tax=uncultured Planktosalinus sp. TaxID=1810935 RepID=UPI0030D8148F
MKIALLGYGKMGKTIEKLAVEKGHQIVAVCTRKEELNKLSGADVAIDFSVPEAAVLNIEQCFEQQIPIVSGTTGWLNEFDRVLKSCQNRNGSFIYASNFSVGVNLFFDLNRKLAQLMAQQEDYKVAITEIHHIQKLDTPSGTAISLANDIIEHSNYTSWKLNAAEKGVIPVTAVREEDVKGTHSITYQSAVDTISIKHEAHSREGFAKGALLAAEWLQGKKGFFTMKDVLGIEP